MTMPQVPGARVLLNRCWKVARDMHALLFFALRRDHGTYYDKTDMTLKGHPKHAIPILDVQQQSH